MTAYVGVDLAWGERARTGLAVLDGAGALRASCSVRSDDEIAAFVGEHCSGGVVAGVDAPLVVPNDTGQRRCEALVGAAFGRYGAGAYPANRGNPAFFPQPRGARLAERFGWDMDPAVAPSDTSRVCLEVYPHPAMVSLFGLDYVIPYKGKQGRDVAFRRVAFERLLDHIEGFWGASLGLADAPRWAHLRSVVRDAARPVELDVVEDEVDAIVCARVAWLWGTARDQLVVHGDFASGYIVTPLPPTVAPGRPLRASPQAAEPDRAPPMDPQLAAAFRAAVPRLSVEECERLAQVAAQHGSGVAASLQRGA